MIHTHATNGAETVWNDNIEDPNSLWYGFDAHGEEHSGETSEVCIQRILIANFEIAYADA